MYEQPVEPLSARLAVTRVAGRSVVTGARPAGPLRLLAPSNHGHAAWVYQSSLGGGFVGGDDLSLAVEVHRGAALFLSSQAQGRAYRGARSRYALEARVGEGAVLVAWPDPLACFAGAALEQRQRFRLAAGAGLLCVDAWSAGRTARGERWAFERLQTRLTVEGAAGERLLDDAALLAPAHGDLAARLRPAGALATVVLAGPPLAAACAALPEAIAARPPGRIAGGPLVVASARPWGLLLRLGAPSVESLGQALQTLLRRTVEGLLGDDPWARKW